MNVYVGRDDTFASGELFKSCTPTMVVSVGESRIVVGL